MTQDVVNISGSTTGNFLQGRAVVATPGGNTVNRIVGFNENKAISTISDKYDTKFDDVFYYQDIPRHIPNLIMWNRADIGFLPSRWKNIVDTAPDLVQGTASLQPALKKNIVNGHPAVLFASDAMASEAELDLSGGTGLTVFAVVKGTAAQGAYMLMEQSASVGANNGFNMWCGSPPLTIKGSLAQVTTPAANSTWDVNTSWHIAEIRGWDGTDINAWDNGTSISGATATNPGNLPNSTLYVAATNQASLFFPAY